MSKIDPWYLQHLVCPIDHSSLRLDGNRLVSEAGRPYPIVDGVPIMLVDQERQTHHVAGVSLERAKGNREVVDERAPEFYLESLGISEDEKRRLIQLWREGKAKIDPVALLLQGATSGNAYGHLTGSEQLDSYPIPEIRLPPATNGELLLDVGCGWGRWSIAAARKGYSVAALDPSLGSVMATRRIAQELGHQIKGVVGDGRFLPFKAASLDTVFSFGVLQHLSKDDARATVAEMSRVLRPGGTVQVQMAAAWGLRSLQQQARRGFREPVRFDVRYWSPPELKRAFTKAFGKTRVSVDCFFGLGWQWSDYRFMRNKLKPILIASEVLRRISTVITPMHIVADSVYCTSTKRA